MEKPADISCERLLNLRYWLNYEISSGALYILSHFGLIFLGIVALLAVIFTPYMLIILYKERRFGWITFFFIFIVIPLVVVHVFPFDNTYLVFLEFIPISFFYFYCFLLRLTIDDWIAEKRGFIERKYRVKPIEKFEDLWPKR